MKLSEYLRRKKYFFLALALAAAALWISFFYIGMTHHFVEEKGIFTPPHYSQWMSLAAKSALTAGIFLAVALFLAGLFLFWLYYEKANWGLLLLCLTALAFCLQNTVSYGVFVIWFLQTPIVSWAVSILPALFILWFLWYQTLGRLRRFGWLIPALCSALALFGVAWRLADNAWGTKWIHFLRGKLLPLTLLLVLLLCGWQAYKGNAWYRRFFRLGGSLGAAAGLYTLLSCLQDGAWWQSLSAMAQKVSMLGSFFQPMQMLNLFLLFLFFLLAVYDLIHSLILRDNELQALTLQTRYATEHAAYLRRSLDETRQFRHEMRHHYEALKALCQEGDLSRISDYVEQFSGKLGNAPSHYTDNVLINALVSSCADRAGKLNADFAAAIQVPERIGIEDADLAVFISNMIDNALEALSRVPEEKDRRLILKVEIFEDTGLFISCTNSFWGKLNRNERGELLSSKKEPGHGLGLKAMHRIADKYNSVLVIEQEEHTFCVKTYLPFIQKG